MRNPPLLLEKPEADLGFTNGFHEVDPDENQFCFHSLLTASQIKDYRANDGGLIGAILCVEKERCLHLVVEVKFFYS